MSSNATSSSPAPGSSRPEPQLPKHLRPIGIVIALVALLVVIVLLITRHIAYAKLRDRTDAQAVPVVTVKNPTSSGASQSLILPGEIQAYTDAPIYAQTSGYIKKWFFDIGANVRAGQLLAEIDTPEVDQQYFQSLADLQTAQANYDLAKSTDARWKELLKQGSVSQQDADEKAGDAAAKKATLASSKANVDRLKALESFKRVVAPFTGIVTARNVDIGDFIGTAGSVSNKELFHVADTHVVRIYVQVPQTLAAQITPGTTAQLTFTEQPGASYFAKLAGTAGALDPATKTLLVQMQADNASGSLFPGAYATVEFKLKNAIETLRVPDNTLIFNAGGTQLAVVTDDNRVVLKPVTMGRDFGDQMEILSGITAQDRVVINPTDSIANGDEVRIAAPTDNNRPAHSKDDAKPSDQKPASS